MKNYAFSRKTSAASLLAFSTFAVASHAAIAAETNAAPPALNTMLESGLAADVVVPDAKITLEARRLPLREVVAAVAKQTKVALTIAPDTFDREPKLTLALTQMPLREWMESLATLYDVRWESNGPDAFRLQASGRSEGARGLRRMGTEYNYWNWSYRQAQRPDYLPARAVPDWKGMVDDNLDLNALNTTGVPFTAAPPELQKQVRATVEHHIATELLLNALRLDLARGPLSLSVTKPPGGSGWTINKGQRNQKANFAPFPITALILGRYGVGIDHLSLLPLDRGLVLLRDPAVFKLIDRNNPNLAQVTTPAQGGG